MNNLVWFKFGLNVVVNRVNTSWMFTFGVTMVIFARCIVFKCLSWIIWFRIYQSIINIILTWWLLTYMYNYFLKIILSLSIMDFWNSKMWIGQLIELLINWRIHIKFHSKLFIMTIYALKNNWCDIFSLKIYSNGSYGLLKCQN
jgi:hypothetical protein